MKYVCKQSCFHDGIYFFEGDEVNLPDGAEPSAHFEPKGAEVEQKSVRDDAIEQAQEKQIKSLASKLKLGKASLEAVYKKAGAKTTSEKLDALEAYSSEQ